MNRRSFLHTLGIGVVATATLAHIPASVIKSSEWLTTAGNDWALRRLSKIWHAYVKAHKVPPSIIVVSTDFFHLFENQILPSERWVSSEDVGQGYPSLVFKSTRVKASEKLKGYDYTIGGRV